MNLTFRTTDIDSPDAQLLLSQLNETLVGILGHNGTAHVCWDDFAAPRALFVVGYDDDTPVCCAGVRRLDEHTGEVKRVFALPNHRGYGTALMRAVEDMAQQAGYDRLVLECRMGNPHAIAFYRRIGYAECAKYPPYGEEGDAVCMARTLTLGTRRLCMRHWRESDAADLYRYAADPDVGPAAGWPPHQSEKESLRIIQTVLNGAETYAICLRQSGRAIGAIELKLNGHTDMTDRDDECELGYWLGKPYWGQGLMPEAADAMLMHAFVHLGMRRVWCGYYDGNDKSRRVQKKLGFRYQWTTEGLDVPLLHETRIGHANAITREEWLALHGQ